MDNFQRIVDDLKSTDFTTETIAEFKDLLEKTLPETSTKIIVETLLQYVFKNNTKNRNELLNLIIDCPNIDVKYLNKTDAAKFKLQCRQEFVEDIDKLQSAENTDWSILCITLFRILGTSLHHDVDIINRVLKTIENGFRNKALQKCEAYKCWMGLIRNYSLVPSYLKQAKQLRLLIKPLKVPLSKQGSVVEIRFDTFVLLLGAVGNDAMNSYIDFLQFIFNIGKVVACEATVLIPSYKNIWPKSAAVLFQSLGCEGSIENICNYKTEIATLVDVKYFENNYKCLVYAARICSELTYQWCSKTDVKQIIEPLWTKIFQLTHSCSIKENVLLNISEHFNELFKIMQSNDFVYEFILMPILEIIYKNPDLNSAIFRSELLIPFVKLYIADSTLHNRSRNEAVAKLVSFAYSSYTMTELYPILDSLTYCEILELIWYQTNNTFVADVENDKEHSILKANILTYLKWPVENVKYFNTNDCILKLWKSTIIIIHKTDPDIISQLLDSLKLSQEKHTWIIVNIMLISAVLLEIATRKTTTMECIAVTLNECLENIAKETNQFLLYKHAFFQSYMCLSKHMTGTSAISLNQSLDKLIQNLPDLIIKSIPRSFVQFMEDLSKTANSIEAMNIVTKLRPKPLHSTPTIISRSKKMANFNYSPLLPNFSKKAISNESETVCPTTSSNSDKKPVGISDIYNFECNLESSPKSSFIDKVKKKNKKPAKHDKVAIHSRTKSIMEFADNVFVQIDKVVSPDITKMSAHQRDAMRRRRDDIPALYSDLSQSQSQHSHDISSQNICDVQIIQNVVDSNDLEPTQLLNSDNTDCLDTKPVDFIIEDTSEKVPRKKLFNDESDTDSNSIDNIVKNSEIIDTNAILTEIKEDSDKIITEPSKEIIVDKDTDTAKDEELIKDKTGEENEIKTRSSTKLQNRITRFRAQQFKPVQYFKSRSHKSKSQSPSPKPKTKKNPSPNNKNDSPNAISNSPCENETKGDCISSDKIKTISANNEVPTESLNKPKKSKRGKVKFIMNWNTCNNAPAKHITGDMDLYPSTDFIEDFKKPDLISPETENAKDATIEHSETNKNEFNSEESISTPKEIDLDASESNNDEIIACSNAAVLQIEENCVNEDVILNSQSNSEEKIILSDKLRNEIKRLRMDIVGGNVPSIISSKRVRKEKFNLNTPKVKRGRPRKYPIIKDIENDSTASTNSFTSDTTSESDSKENDLEPFRAVSNMENTVNNLICDADPEIIVKKNEDFDVPNTQSEDIFENNYQEVISQPIEDEKQLLPDNESTFEENKIKDLETTSIKKTADINSEEAEKIMETQPIKEPLLNISFIGSMTIEPHDANNDFNTKDTLSIGFNEIETETCSFNSVDKINEQNLIPSSPVTITTPSKNQTLLNDTLEVSPINAMEFSRSPDLFESETAAVIEKVIEDSPSESGHLNQENDAIIITAIVPEIKQDNIEIPKAFVGQLAPHKLLSSANVMSSPKTHRIQKMMQQLEDKKCTNTPDSKEIAADYSKDDLLEFSANLPKPDARPRTPSILKRKAPDYLDEGISPLSKRKRVNFSDPPTTSSKVYLKSDEENLQRILKKSGKLSMKPHYLNNQNDMTFNIKVNIKNNGNNNSEAAAQVANECPDNAKVTITETEKNGGELSDFYPELLDCSEDVELLHNLKNSIDEIRNKGIATIGDIVRLKRSEIEDLSIAEPKFARVNSALSIYCCKNKNSTYEVETSDNIHKIINVDCSDKTISNVNIINNIILPPKQIDCATGLAAISENIKNNIKQLMNEGHSPDEIGEQLNNILRSCNLPLSVNLPYF